MDWIFREGQDLLFYLLGVLMLWVYFPLLSIGAIPEVRLFLTTLPYLFRLKLTSILKNNSLQTRLSFNFTLTLTCLWFTAFLQTRFPFTVSKHPLMDNVCKFQDSNPSKTLGMSFLSSSEIVLNSCLQYDSSDLQLLLTSFEPEYSLPEFRRILAFF